MKSDKFKLTVHMVSSLDGFIAKKDNDVSWFETSDSYEKGVELSDEDQKGFLKLIDCYVMGSRTYETALELSKSYGWVYGEIPTIVVTNRNLPIERQNIETFSGNIGRLVKEKLKLKYRNVWLVGGAALAANFIRSNLVDEICLSILPIILGDGIPFFPTLEKEQPLHLLDEKVYKNGVVELRYEIKKQ